MDQNFQTQFWSKEFGSTFTDRNLFTTVAAVDEDYKKRSGMTRSAMNLEFLGNLNRDIKILEVGSNIGGQLAVLQALGFKNLYGIEINDYAISQSKKLFQDLNIIKADAFDIPFKDNYFDLVFTSVILIHIHPDKLSQLLPEIYRVTKKYIWGYEYYSPEVVEINYRGNSNVLWKMDYKQRYLDLCPDLEVLKEKDYHYLNENNRDQMFLLKKSGSSKVCAEKL